MRHGRSPWRHGSPRATPRPSTGRWARGAGRSGAPHAERPGAAALALAVLPGTRPLADLPELKLALLMKRPGDPYGLRTSIALAEAGRPDLAAELLSGATGIRPWGTFLRDLETMGDDGIGTVLDLVASSCGDEAVKLFATHVAHAEGTALSHRFFTALADRGRIGSLDDVGHTFAYQVLVRWRASRGQ
ncbi:hypothetical protein O1L60_29815 [Streptomyces diastatochromogenes]|nr:hypothetical protein [Streptomyces diastatochromogenes]